MDTPVQPPIRLRCGMLSAPQQYHTSPPKVIAIMTYFSRDLICLGSLYKSYWMISFIYFCSTFYLRCNQVDACSISFSILHSISWEEYTTNLFISSIDRLLGFQFVAIMTSVAVNILVHVSWCTYTYTSIGNMSRSRFLSCKRGICSGFQNADKHFPKGLY